MEVATGIILRTRPLTDTSLIVHWLTGELGRIATVAKGARRVKSPLLGKLDLFYLADFSLVRSRRSDLHTLREVTLKETHPALRKDLSLIQQAAYFAKLIELSTETETPLPGPYRLCAEALQAISCHPPTSVSVLGFEFKLLNELGLGPNLPASRLSPGSQGIANLLTSASWEHIFTLRLASAQDLELRQFLHGFLIYHLGRLPSGRERALGGRH